MHTTSLLGALAALTTLAATSPVGNIATPPPARDVSARQLYPPNPPPVARDEQQGEPIWITPPPASRDDKHAEDVWLGIPLTYLLVADGEDAVELPPL